MSPMKDPAKRREYVHAYYRARPEQFAEYERRNFLRRHGPGIIAAVAAMWEEQDGCCYLCGEPLRPGKHTHIDHDHSCCPTAKSCQYCRRGLACDRCNKLIGLAEDDPELLRLIAGRLQVALAATREQMSGKPEQMELSP